MIRVREVDDLLLLRGYRDALELATEQSNLREPPITKDIAINVLDHYINNIILSRSQGRFIEQLKLLLETSLFINTASINLIGVLNRILSSSVGNNVEQQSIDTISINNNFYNIITVCDNNFYKNSLNQKVIINGNLITDKQMEKIRNCFIEITGYQDLSSQELNILTDIVRAIDFIFKGGKLEYNFEGSIIPQWGFDLKCQPELREESGKNDKYHINTVLEAKEFIEAKIKEVEIEGELVLERILKKIYSSVQPEISRAGQILHFILYNKVDTKVCNIKSNNRRYSL